MKGNPAIPPSGCPGGVQYDVKFTRQLTVIAFEQPNNEEVNRWRKASDAESQAACTTDSERSQKKMAAGRLVLLLGLACLAAGVLAQT